MKHMVISTKWNHIQTEKLRDCECLRKNAGKNKEQAEICDKNDLGKQRSIIYKYCRGNDEVLRNIDNTAEAV